MAPHIVAVIPARFGSTRLPAKPLVKLLGRPMIQWVIKAARAVPMIDEVIVATDDERVLSAVAQAGAVGVMTPVACPTGTDRIHEALRGRAGDIVVNIQGDWPATPRASIETAINALLGAPWAAVATCCNAITNPEDFDASHIVKVVRGAEDRALFFSRAPIPSLARWSPADRAAAGGVLGYKHFGLYVYRREALAAFVTRPQSALEKRESLEQLRFLESGHGIVCPETPHDAVGVDVADEVPRAESALREMWPGGDW